jgi:hypothetical protein
MFREQVSCEQAGQKRAAPLTDQDHAIIGRVESTLADGLALKRWWEGTDALDSYSERFELVRQFNQSGTSMGFFGRAALGDRMLTVMGSIEDSLYDQRKQLASERALSEFREFILHYFMRISSYRQPETYIRSGRPVPSGYPRGLSWCTERETSRVGFGFSQHYYKLRGSGVIDKFRESEEFAIVDLREIGERYEWIVVKVHIFDFNLIFRLFGFDEAQLAVPLNEETYLVMSRDFIVNQESTQPGVLGRYGFGYTFIRNQTQGVIAYGPGQFDAAIELINFRVLESGETRVHTVFVANRPERILSVSIDPITWSFGLADLMSFGLISTLFAPIKSVLGRLPLRLSSFDPLSAYISLADELTGGAAAEGLCVSKEQLEKDFLVQHFMQHYRMIVGTLLTWRQIPNWLDSTRLPEWVVSGISS